LEEEKQVAAYLFDRRVTLGSLLASISTRPFSICPIHSAIPPPCFIPPFDSPINLFIIYRETPLAAPEFGCALLARFPLAFVIAFASSKQV
jgi:hypothetical protein